MILLTGYSGDIGSSIRSIAQLEKIKLGRLRFPRVELAAKNNLLSQLIAVHTAARKNGVKVSVFHLGHPATDASVEEYRTFYRNSLVLFSSCRYLGIPLYFASSASCYLENQSFYSNFKRSLEVAARLNGHQSIRLGIFTGNKDDNTTFRRISLVCRVLVGTGFSRLVQDTAFFTFGERELLSLLIEFELDYGDLTNSSYIRYLISGERKSASEIFLSRSKQVRLSLPFVQREYILHLLGSMPRVTVPGRFDAFVNFLHGHKLEEVN